MRPASLFLYILKSLSYLILFFEEVYVGYLHDTNGEKSESDRFHFWFWSVHPESSHHNHPNRYHISKIKFIEIYKDSKHAETYNAWHMCMKRFMELLRNCKAFHQILTVVGINKISILNLARIRFICALVSFNFSVYFGYTGNSLLWQSLVTFRNGSPKLGTLVAQPRLTRIHKDGRENAKSFPTDSSYDKLDLYLIMKTWHEDKMIRGIPKFY